MRRLALAAATVALWGAMAPADSCFGTRLRVAVPAGVASPSWSLAAYAAGYFVQEKTGIEPEFVEATESALDENRADLALVSAAARPPRGVVTRPAGEVAGVGPAQFWLRAEVLDDLRFSTVERALGKLPAFFASPAYALAHRSASPPKKAARKAVLDGT